MTVSEIQQILFVIEWLIFLLLLQISIWPFLKPICREYSLPLSFPISLLLTTFISWYIALAGLPIQLTLAPFILILGYSGWNNKISLPDITKEWRWYVIFFGTFLITLLVRLWYNCAIDVSYEKLMDSMILSSMILNPQIPPLDGWFAGGYLTWYYYLAAWIFAVPANILSIPASVTYNLALPTIFAISAVLIYSCSSILLVRFRYLPLFLLFISYPGFLSYTVQFAMDKIPLRYVLDRTVRIIPEAITENPLSALLIGSPRPYAVALMIQCLILFLLIYSYTRWKEMCISSRMAVTLMLAFCLGTLIPLHTWDFIIYVPLTVATGILLSYHLYLETQFQENTSVQSGKSKIWFWLNHLRSCIRDISCVFRDLSSTAVIFVSLFAPALSLLIYLPFLFEMENQRMQGVVLLLNASEPVPFLLVHGLFLLLLVVYLRNDIVRKPLYLGIPAIVAVTGFISAAMVLVPVVYLVARKFGRIEEILAFTGLICILGCDFFAIVQNGSPDRANTTYKFYFAAWVLLGLSTFSLLGEMLGQIRLFSSDLRYKIVSLILIAGALCFPVVLLSSGPLWTPSLDGTNFVSEYVGSEELHALDYLRSLPPGEVLIEGVVPMSFDVDTYGKYFSRLSSYTGIPSVMGSFFREQTYRGTEATWVRGEDSESVYIKPDQAAEIMAKYNATLLYVGIPEIFVYKIEDPAIYMKYGFKPVFYENATVIWRPPHYPG